MMGQQKNDCQSLDVSVEMHQDQGPHEDGLRLKRTGALRTVIMHIITAMIGSSVFSLAWAMAQLGWVAGMAVLILFSFVTYYTSTLLASCYRTSDPITGVRNYTYIDVVRSTLGGAHAKICGLLRYVHPFGVAICCTVEASISMVAISRSNCFHRKGAISPNCHTSSNLYVIAFGIIEIVLSQIPDFNQLWLLSMVAAVMSFTYSIIGLGLSIAKVSENRKFKGSLTGISIGNVTGPQKIWRSFQALGDVAFAYSHSTMLIEIQDTIRSSPSESKTMKAATLMSVAVATVIYMLCGCVGYVAFGDMAPENLLTGFGFHNPYWIVDIANAANVIHLVGAYQVYCQPLFAFIEKQATQRFSDIPFITREIEIPIPRCRPYKLNLFRLVWRTIFVIITTVISMLLPFFNNDLIVLFGALGFWPLTVCYPVEMYIAQMKIPKWSTKWVCLRILSVACLIITMAAVAGSVARVVLDLSPKSPSTQCNIKLDC